MNDSPPPEKHYAMSITDDVTEICKPLALSYGINYFLYARIFDDGSLYTLISRKDIYLNHFKNQHNTIPFETQSFLNKKFSYILLPNIDDNFNQVVYDFQNLFNLYYPIYLIERFSGFVDISIYGTSNKNMNYINFYFNHFDVLEKFQFYFKDKAQKLIQKSMKNKILLPESMRPSFDSLSNEANVASNNAFINLTLKKYYLCGKLGDVAITNRELEILKHIAAGCTAKEVAKRVRISPRTIEAHLNNIKLKCGTKSKVELIELISDQGLI